MERMTIMTASPVEAARPMRVSDPFVFWFTMAVAVPVKMRIIVPINSAPHLVFSHAKTQNCVSKRFEFILKNGFYLYLIL